MTPYSRWLRLLVGQALAEIARDAETGQGAPAAAGASQAASEAFPGPEAAPEAPEGAPGPPGGPVPPHRRPQSPALFLLDEFAALGRLEAVERAMGLMAAYGLQLWPILQDMKHGATSRSSG